MQTLIRICVFISIAITTTAAHAIPICLRSPERFNLSSDTVKWSFTIGEGQECIQGLHYSTMIMGDVEVQNPPKLGHFLIRGSSFTYRAWSVFDEPDSFTIKVTGTNRKEPPGFSLIEVSVQKK
jgi:hypothetical protein